VAAASIALMVDLVLHHGVATLSGSLCSIVAAVAVVMVSERRGAALYGCAGSAAAASIVLAWRDAWWLDALSICFVLTFLSLAAAMGRLEQRRLGLRAPFVEGVVALGSLFAGLGGVQRLVADGTRHRAQRARIPIAAAALVGVSLGALLLGADALAQSYLQSVFDGSALVLHVTALAVGLGGVLGMQWLTTYRPKVSKPLVVLEDRVHHWAIVAAVVVLAMYTAVRVTAALAGDRYVLAQTGLTYAEYARRGFFSLMLVASIVIVLVHEWGRASRSTRWWSTGAVVLTAVVIGCAVQGLVLYQRAFGQSMMRWVAVSLCVALAAALLALTATLWRDSWAPLLPSLFAAIGVMWFLAISTLNPEASLARSNLHGAAPTAAALDIRYLRDLDDDALPGVLAWLSENANRNDDTMWLRDRLCALDRPALRLLNFNWSRAEARRALQRYC
jgi:hypothetical protein